MEQTTQHRSNNMNPINTRRRGFKILRLFFGLVASFLWQYVRARLRGRSYNFFEDAQHNRQRAIKIRETALEMGGVLIKVGQFLSSRVDLLPSEYIEELALLQDEVPGVPFEDIRAAIEQQLGKPPDQLFAAFSPVPVAAASLGQVHRAVLPTGQVVAVKVQRPNIRQIVEADLVSIRYIVHWLQRYTALSRRISLPEVLREFEDTLRLELDYHQEGHHAERLAIMFADNPRIRVPRIFWSHSSERVLTMQYIRGIKVTDFNDLERRGIARSEVAEILMGAYLQQVLGDGFFHADPHPGNIFVQPGPVVVLLDFGMVGEITPKTRDNIRRVFLGVVRHDYDDVILALQRLGFFTRGADVQSIRRALSWAVETFYSMSFGELQSIDPRQVIDQLQDVLFSESFQIPANYAFLGRALGTLSGLCTALDPSFQFVTVAEPYAKNLLRNETGVVGTLRLAGREARVLGRTVYNLPFLTQRVLENVQSGDLNLRGQFEDVVYAVDRLEHTGQRIFDALFVIGFSLIGSLTLRTHYSLLAMLCFILAVLFLLRLLFSLGRKPTKTGHLR